MINGLKGSVNLNRTCYSLSCSKYAIKIKFERNITLSLIIMYSLYVYYFLYQKYGKHTVYTDGGGM